MCTKTTRPTRDLTHPLAPSELDVQNITPKMKEFVCNIPLTKSAVTRYQSNESPTGVIEVHGDILESDCDVIIHCCNCFNTMGAGIAKLIKDRWPEAYDIDSKTPRRDRNKLGYFSSCLTSDNFTVINLYAQFDYGRPEDGRRLNYDALRVGLQRFLWQLDKQGARPKIGTYYLGCSNAGGDIKEVLKILQTLFTEHPLYIYVDKKPKQKKDHKPNDQVDYSAVTKAMRYLVVADQLQTKCDTQSIPQVSINYADVFGKSVENNN